MELTEQDREEIKNQIAEYKANLPAQRSIAAPIAPNGVQTEQDLDRVITEESVLNKRENKKFRKKIRSIWSKWRNTALDAKALEEEKVACQIAVERAKTQAELDRVKREEEKAKAQHWLDLNIGNLEEVGLNTKSKPSIFWYNIKRGFFYITKITDNIPKLILNLFWGACIIVGFILLKKYNII